MATGYLKNIRQSMTDWVNGKTPTFTPVTAFFVGLSTALPLDDFTALAEPTIGTGAYARSTSINTAAGWTTSPAPSNDAAAVGGNAVAVSFPASSAAWSTTTTAIPYFFVSTSATSTTASAQISRGALTPSTTTVNATGITLSFAIGALTLNLTPV